MRVELFIGLRYLFSRRNSRIPSIFTLISIGGVLLGVMALIVILAVLNGFHDDLKEKILGTMPHVTLLNYVDDSITGYDSLLALVENTPGVADASPLIYSEGMVVGRGGENTGAFVRGVIPEQERQVVDIDNYIYSGAFSFDYEETEGEKEYPGTVIGSYMAQILRVGVGDEITLWAPKGIKITPFGLSAPWRKFRVTGIFETGLYEVDAQFLYVSLADAQSFFGYRDAINKIEVRLEDIERAREMRDELVDVLGGYPYSATDWISHNRNLFEALKLEKVVMFIILTLIVLVAASNIVSTLTMLVMDKNREIGILRSMGLTSRAVGRIFVFNGLIIGTVGTALGASCGWGLSVLLNTYDLISVPGDVYFISSIPVNIQAGDIVIICAASMAISLLATLYPAFRAATLPPVEAIRHE
ncbi:MAG: lipoprotein-releasing ABC transporter permease subunit [Candidatus Glassbacteria bacterium]|nr:lipoprotein-releasing ABC transporter permease subunit [Candidatus Glassbacteria bacterium]